MVAHAPDVLLFVADVLEVNGGQGKFEEEDRFLGGDPLVQCIKINMPESALYPLIPEISLHIYDPFFLPRCVLGEVVKKAAHL